MATGAEPAAAGGRAMGRGVVCCFRTDSICVAHARDSQRIPSPRFGGLHTCESVAVFPRMYTSEVETLVLHTPTSLLYILGDTATDSQVCKPPKRRQGILWLSLA